MAILTLGGVTFYDLEIPEKVTIPGEQKLVVHKLIGGQRVIDAMGPDPGEIEWSGHFRPNFFDGFNDAAAWASRIEAMRDSGQPQSLTCGTVSKTVLIKHFQWDYERQYQLSYSIKLEVVNNGPGVSSIKNAPKTLDTLFFEDIQNVQILMARFPTPVTI